MSDAGLVYLENINGIAALCTNSILQMFMSTYIFTIFRGKLYFALILLSG